MAQTLIRNEDFETGALFSNIRGMIYQGAGSPVGRVNSPNSGAIYIDNLTGQLWLASASGEPATWRPYFTNTISNARIDSDVQEGDVVGIFGLGAWTTSTATLGVAKQEAAGAGSQNAALVAGGNTSGASQPTNVTELFNGLVWSTSGGLSQPKGDMAGLGSQNAALVAGGNTTSGTNATELFNGSTWVAGGSLSQVKRALPGAGTQNAGLVAGGNTASAITRETELFNGATWSVATGVLSVAKQQMASAGTQNAGLVAGGFTSAVTNVTELFNGSSWSLSGNISAAKSFIGGGAGSQNSAFIAGGNTGNFASISELFNGSSWSASGFLSIVKDKGTAVGSPLAGLYAGGATLGALTNATELHNQTIYRKLVYNAVQNAVNIGVVFNSTTTSLTASIIRGDVSGNIVPGNTWFGISRFNNPSQQVFVTSTTATISSISSTITNQAVLNLSASLTTGFAIGSLLRISNGTTVPIIGGTILNPVVRWENVSTSASTSLTVGCVWGQRVTFGLVNIVASGATATVTQTATLQYTSTYKGRVGDTLYIPYSTVSGTNGSSLFYGTYTISNVTTPATDVIAFTITVPSALGGVTESNIGQATVMQQLVCTTGSFSPEDAILGMKNKMKIPMTPDYDDLSNGLI